MITGTAPSLLIECSVSTVFGSVYVAAAGIATVVQAAHATRALRRRRGSPAPRERRSATLPLQVLRSCRAQMNARNEHPQRPFSTPWVFV
jgi:hypothetical protein